MHEKNNISFCGLYCPDCIPAQRQLFAEIRRFQSVLSAYHIREYIETCKLGNNSAFDQYESFFAVLDALQKEECVEFCRTGPYSVNNCTPACAIRICCQEKDLDGCWECLEYEKCPHITAMLPRHPDMKYSLKMLRLHGPEGFPPVRGKAHTWSCRHCPDTNCQSDGMFCTREGNCSNE